MPNRTIEHPGVEIFERDFSSIATHVGMSTVLVLGYSDYGEENIPTSISDISSFKTNFGTPKSDAELYSYYACKKVLEESGNLLFIKLPYSNEATGKYRAQTFQILDSTSTSGNAQIAEMFNVPVSGCGVKRIGVDSETILLDYNDIDSLRNGATFQSVQSQPINTKSFIIINKSRDILQGDNEKSGIFVMILPLYNAIPWQYLATFETLSSPIENWDLFAGIRAPSGVTIRDWTSANDWLIPPTDIYTNDSLSKSILKYFPTISQTADGIDREYLNQVVVLVCKSYINPTYGNVLNFEFLEKHVGSLYYKDKDIYGNSIFLGDIINSNSKYIEFYFNSIDENLQETVHAQACINNVNKITNNIIYTVVNNPNPEDIAGKIEWNLLSFTNKETEKNIVLETLLSNIDAALEKVKNVDDYDIDIIIDAGLSNIAQYVSNHTTGVDVNIKYNPSKWSSLDEINSQFDLEVWKTVISKLTTFAEATRKDCMVIADAPRALAVKGNEKLITPEKTTATNNIDTIILPKLKYLMFNSSYLAEYVTWCKVINDFSGTAVWLPPTTKVIGNYLYTERLYNYFEAPYGMTRGIISDIVDISFNPNSKQQDAIYLKGLNYISQSTQGFVVMGQKTTLQKQSDFSRVNVRRLFLKLEKITYKTLKMFVGEINNYYTRTRIVDILTPVFNNVKLLGGIYDFKVVCDETINTPEVIQNNELRLNILISASSVADFILATFAATKYGANFEEIVIT